MALSDFRTLKFFTPYVRLLRLDNTTGIWLTLWPALWSIAFASGNTLQLDVYTIFILGAIVMRSAGCVINDIIDRKIDAKVARTRNRPLASGKVSLFEALMIVFLLLTAGYFLLIQLGTTAQYLGYGVVGLAILYPFMKRITYWPQLFLGITFNWGILMGWASVRGSINWDTMTLYAAAVLWTLGYDTIYGHQDKMDDVKLGVKSTAIKYNRITRRLLYICYGGSALLLWIMGIRHGIGMLFFAGLFFGIILLLWQIIVTDFNKPEQCERAFRINRFYGLVIYLSIMGGLWAF